MRSLTNSFRISCLLTLIALTGFALTSCESEHQDHETDHPVFEEVDEGHIRSHVQSSSRPYSLVNFYATWCKPCKVEMPELIDLHKEEGSQVNVMLVSLDEPEVVDQKLASFLHDLKVDFPSFIAEGDGEALVRSFYPEWDGYIPLSLIFDKEGTLIETVGMTDKDEVEMIINRNELLNN